MGLGIVTGDVLNLSHVFQVAQIKLNRAPAFRKLTQSGAFARFSEMSPSDGVIAQLNAAKPLWGYLSTHFSSASTAGRTFFTEENASKLDGMRAQIKSWRSAALLSDLEEKYLLAALVDAADRVANTAGTYYAHLKHISRKAVKPVALRVPQITKNSYENICNLKPANDVVRSHRSDLLYLDPPYNERDYSGYYHLPETIVLGDAAQPKGKSGVPSLPRQEVSDFCRPAKATKALEVLLDDATAKHIIVHYATEGLIPHKAILRMLRDKGKTRYKDYPVRAYGSVPHCNRASNAWHRIYWCDVGT
jgi:adenine-specific DNA-methyltransferase